MKVGVLGLQGDVREHLAALGRLGATGTVVKTSSELDDVDGLIIPGGESTTIGKLLDRFGLLEPLRKRASEGMPLFGTCAGLILMASEVVGEHRAEHLLGVLNVTVRRNAYGRQVDSFESRIEAGGGEVLKGAFIRAPAIEEVGADVEVLGTLDGAPVLVRERNLLGATFHPEIAGEDRVHELFLNSIQGSEN